MIRIKQVVTKPTKLPREKVPKSTNEENIRPHSFNTRGYFDPSQPFNEDYLKLKQQVFEKYRNKKEEIIMLDPKQTSKAAFIQRGLLPSKTLAIDPNAHRPALEQVSYNLLKNYLLRKEKKENQEQEKFSVGSGVSCDQLSIRSGALTARSRQVSSRISTHSVLKIESEF